MNKSVKIIIRGSVQGVGFRPFIFKLANHAGVKGFVRNTGYGVEIEAEGNEKKIESFIHDIPNNKPDLSVISDIEVEKINSVGYKIFEIKKSKDSELVSTTILPDIAICKDCLSEMYDPSDRRYLYPFLNCTNCGPRFSIIENLPYDRPNTVMNDFKMCGECEAEYNNPFDRRFHAQPTACPNCGPSLEFCDSRGRSISKENNAILDAADFLKNGAIVALKGIGGFQLIVDAANPNAVAELRKRKLRNEKPFALMFPNLNVVQKFCDLTSTEEKLLNSKEAPIVLLRKILSGSNTEVDLVFQNSAPSNPYLGVMLPYSPLHHLLMKLVHKPIIATSGNIAEEPICIDNLEAINRLNNIADYFLLHNRRIVRHLDDSIVRVIDGHEFVIRRARGYAPFPFFKNNESKNTKEYISFGSHLKNTISISVDNKIIVSQHIGDLENCKATSAFSKVIKDFSQMYNLRKPEYIVDKHPDYYSTKYLSSRVCEFKKVQHHYAHIAACRVDNNFTGRGLGVAWDGTGFGDDGSIWGSEFFISEDKTYSHVAQFLKFKLPGGDKASRDGRRSLAGVLFNIYGDVLFKDKVHLLKSLRDNEIYLLKEMLVKNINSPLTTSAGRLFDAVASLIDLSHHSSYEAQAAMALEFLSSEKISGSYSFEIIREKIYKIDWRPMIIEIEKDIEENVSKKIIASKFHHTLAQMILAVCEEMKEQNILISGGCFQNALLVNNTIQLLTSNGYKVFMHQKIPANDGGISVGQIAAVDVIQKPFGIDKAGTIKITPKPL